MPGVELSDAKHEAEEGEADFDHVARLAIGGSSPGSEFDESAAPFRSGEAREGMRIKLMPFCARDRAAYP